jgi:class 3 adenylate cyclase
MHMSANRTLTFLITDLCDSTELMQKLGERAADDLRQTHFGLLRDAIREHEGKEVKNLGDGLMAVFESSADATACAVAMQRALYRHNEKHPQHPLKVRVGIDVGEPFRHERDYFGPPVATAEVLCNRARGGEILAHVRVRAMVGPEGRDGYGAARQVSGKQGAQPLEAVEVIWQG